MCYALPGPRCSGHAKEIKAKAEEAFQKNPSDENRKALDHAISEFLITPAGIDSMRKLGKEYEAERLEKLRKGRMSLFRKQTSTTTGKPGATLKEKLAHASDPATTENEFAMLAKNKNAKVRSVVAMNTRHPAILRALASDTDKEVLAQVAGNPATEGSDLTRIYLAHGSDSKVAGRIVRNENCPAPLYPSLMKQPYPEFARVVAAKPDCPQELIEGLADAKHYSYRAVTAGSERTTRSTLHRLMADEHHAVRRAVAMNPNTTSDMLDYLAEHDDNFQVQSAVRARRLKV